MEFSLSNIYRTTVSEKITLRPFDIEKDAEVLYKMSNGEPYEGYPAYNSYRVIWEKLRYRPITPGFKGFIDYLNEITSTGDQFIFTVELNRIKRQVGLVYFKLDLKNKDAYPGGLWISPCFHRERIGVYTFYTLMNHFYVNGAESVHFATLATNDKLIEGIKMLGFSVVERLTLLSPPHMEYRNLIQLKATRAQWNSGEKI